MSAPKRRKREEPSSNISTKDTRAIAEGKLVETANALSSTEFLEKYGASGHAQDLLVEQLDLQWHYGDATGIHKGLLAECLKLIELTSRNDYEASETKWSSTKKRKEMALPDMKYFVLADQNQRVEGFTSFMVTYEDGHEVVYIYEIHFTPEWQGRGLGKRLLAIVEDVARNVGASKVMLTVFRANKRAVDWYLRLGYQEDEFSPGPRKLRNGTVKQPSYIILSKQVKG